MAKLVSFPALYSMTAAYGGLGGMAAAYPQMAAAAAASSAATSTTAASTSSSVAAAAATTAAGQQQQATTAWMAMYQQLAAQEYFKQLQSAARDPAAYAALAAQGAVLPALLSPCCPLM